MQNLLITYHIIEFDLIYPLRGFFTAVCRLYQVFVVFLDFNHFTLLDLVIIQLLSISRFQLFAQNRSYYF